MDVRYIMLKNRYKFIYTDSSFLYNVKAIDVLKKEISLFNKELAMYNISFKALSSEKVKPVIKDELLNIAVICTENDKFANKIRLTRQLPFKELSSFTKRSQYYLEKWRDYILAYYIIFSNNYSNILSYLSIKKLDNLLEGSKEDPNALKDCSTINSGIVLRVKGKYCNVITPYGDFLKLSIDKELSIGDICSGSLKNERKFFSLPIKVLCVCIVIAAFVTIFLLAQTQRTVVIQSNFSISLELNRFDMVTSSTSENSKGNTILNPLKLHNVSIDSAVLSILEEAQKDNFISGDTPILIYISSNTNSSPNLSKTAKYIRDNKINASINNNGNEIKIEE